MKLNKETLRQMIKEELSQMMSEKIQTTVDDPLGVLTTGETARLLTKMETFARVRYGLDAFSRPNKDWLNHGGSQAKIKDLLGDKYDDVGTALEGKNMNYSKWMKGLIKDKLRQIAKAKENTQ
jgi:hypothetical protein